MSSYPNLFGGDMTIMFHSFEVLEKCRVIMCKCNKEFEEFRVIMCSREFEKCKAIMCNKEFEEFGAIMRNKEFEEFGAIMRPREFKKCRAIMRSKEFEEFRVIMCSREFEKCRAIMCNKEFEEFGAIMRNREFEEFGAIMCPREFKKCRAIMCSKEFEEFRVIMCSKEFEEFRAIICSKEYEKFRAIMCSKEFEKLRAKGFKADKYYIKSIEIQTEVITSATNNFADENLLLHKYYAKLYKGQLWHLGHLINIVTWKYTQEGMMLVANNEISISRILEHKNILSIFKISPGIDESLYILVYKHEANESLDKHLSGSTLTWIQRLHICVGVAQALSYLHNHAGVDGSVIHCNVKSSKVLLDDNWEPKLFGFGYAMIAKRNELYQPSKYKGISQYMDPAYANTRGLTPKSDVFSFGVVLFEVLFGRKASSHIPEDDNWSFARSARLHYENETLDDMIDPDLQKQMDDQSLLIFSEIAYFCLKEERSQRPNTDLISKKLEAALKHQQNYESPELSTELSTTAVQATSLNHWKGKNLDHLKIRWSDIELATSNFSEKYLIGAGGYGTVYKTKLDHFDGSSSLTVSGNYKGDFPKKHSTVAIKRIKSRGDGQDENGFLAEIGILSTCKHPNIVSLLGFCDEGPEMILVYEHVTNRSLDDYFEKVDNLTTLTWAQRLQICLDIARGLNYLHTSTEDKPMIIHCDIKSGNILLDDKWVAKIADFGLSKLHPMYEQRSTLITSKIAGTEVYLDPEYANTGRLKKEADIYSFGVVLFEILCGRLAYDKIYSGRGLPSVARECFNMGTLEAMVDPKIKEADENFFMPSGGLNQDSFNTFSRIAYQCLAETQSKRPTMEVIINELQRAYNFQKYSKDNLQISLEDIKSATQNFSDYKCTGEGRNWKQYEGELPHANVNGCTAIIAKRFDSNSENQFIAELRVLFKYKHENIVALVGYHKEMDERIIVYEQTSKGSLDKYLNDGSLTWMKRLKICLGVASALDFLHRGGVQNTPVMHRDIKSSSILLDGDWRAKISNLELSLYQSEMLEPEHVTDNAYGSLGYVDLLYIERGYLAIESDIYSFGVVLIEMLCGRLAWTEGCEDHSQSLVPWAKRHNVTGNLHLWAFNQIQEQIDILSVDTYCQIAIQCLSDYERPDASDVVAELKKALAFQEDYEIWGPKLPSDYEELIQQSKSYNIMDPKTKKDYYDIFTKGFLVYDGSSWVSLGTNRELDFVVPARRFSYINSWSRKWQSVPESRFEKVAQMLDISNMKIKIKLKTFFLTPGVSYGVHLLFKFCGPRKSTAKRMYVNLKYKRRSDNLQADFATWREDEWMMIELCLLLDLNEDTIFEVLLESFSQCYCGTVVYIEGIEFRVIDNEKYEEIGKLKEAQQVLKSCLNMDVVQECPIDDKEMCNRLGDDHESEKLFLLNKVNGKKWIMLLAKEVLYDSSKVKPFQKPSSESRFQEVIELLPQQVFGIKCKIESQILSSDTDYTCFLVFKLSEKCNGLHSLVKVRNVLQWKNKEIGVVSFRTPTSWNLYGADWFPRKRKDGWMEVIIWKFNSSSERRRDYIPMHLKLITYAGTMSGLIVCGLEIRPI